MSRLEVPTLTGRHLSLEPLTARHVDEVGAAGSGDRSSFRYTQVPDGRDEAAEYVQWLVDDAAHDRAAPFVQRRAVDGVVVGCTRFMNPLWPLGRDAPDEVEIGGTWLSASAQRTPINTEAKLLLLGHAFEALGVWRVAICTDAENGQSRAAIERIGATFEGVLRNHRPKANTPAPQARDTAVYSIVRDEWPAVRAAIQAKLDR